MKEKWLTPFHGYNIKKVDDEFFVYDYEKRYLCKSISVKEAHQKIKEHEKDHSFIVEYKYVEDSDIVKPYDYRIKADTKEIAMEKAKLKLGNKCVVLSVKVDWNIYFQK